MKQTIYQGRNSISNISDILKKCSSRNVFLVTGKNSYVKSGAKEQLEVHLKDFDYFRFCDFEENPKIEDVRKGINYYNQNKFDTVIAIGGGSVLDMAKLINALSRQEGSIDQTIKTNSIHKRGKNLIAIPTTSGTGSEATHFAVTYINNEKYSISHQDILPDFAIIDPQLTYSTPKYVTACTGADAFCQAIESMWAKGGTEESRQYAEESIKLIWNHLKDAVISNNLEARNYMSEASFLAGKAINISKTTASHAISYEITSKYKLPHGNAVSLTLPEILKTNYQNSNNKLTRTSIERIFKQINARDIDDAYEKIKSLFKSIQLKTTLNEIGVKKEDINDIANKCNIERMGNNPIYLNIDNIIRILSNIF